jgi:hypothetical protein
MFTHPNPAMLSLSHSTLSQGVSMRWPSVSPELNTYTSLMSIKPAFLLATGELGKPKMLSR